MAKLGCFTVLTKKKKKKDKGGAGSSSLKIEHPTKSFETNDLQNKGINTLPVKIEHPVKSSETGELKSSYLSISVPLNSMCNVKVMSHESPVGGEAAEVAYEGEDEHEDYSSMKRDFSDFDLQAHDVSPVEEEYSFEARKMSLPDSLDTEDDTQKDAKEAVDTKLSGHLSDPGIGKAEFWATPMHKRSCSNIESRQVMREISGQLSPSKSRSFEQLQELAVMARNDDPRSPLSVISHRSADRVMLKKHSSSQVLPSRSRRLWWKLFLWSHRNLHKPWMIKPQPLPIIKAALNQQGGYSSDTLEPHQHMELDKMKSPVSFPRESGKEAVHDSENDNQSWDGFHVVSGLWPQNQWVAFSDESSSYSRVNDWVKDLDTQPPNDNTDEGIIFPPSPENSRSPARSTNHLTRCPDINVSEEILHANNVIRSLNSSSTVAHISGIGLKVIPTISSFHSLRSVNLSNNLIVHITPGSLPKGLHSLNLSRNKIQTIEGLRELNRLRVLDLSYNRISRVGQGLSNCSLIKELYLAGNKISDVEGLHRLLKLTVLDLSFNKITTTKALGQLVANYNSMLALNLVGNPIQNNISEEQLRKAVCGLLPKIVYLNKQPVKPQRAREVLMDSVAKAALGNTCRSSHRKAVKRVSNGGISAPNGHRSNASVLQKGRSRSKTRTHQRTTTKTLLAATTIPSSPH